MEQRLNRGGMEGQVHGKNSVRTEDKGETGRQLKWAGCQDVAGGAGDQGAAGRTGDHQGRVGRAEDHQGGAGSAGDHQGEAGRAADH